MLIVKLMQKRSIRNYEGSLIKTHTTVSLHNSQSQLSNSQQPQLDRQKQLPSPQHLVSCAAI